MDDDSTLYICLHGFYNPPASHRTGFSMPLEMGRLSGCTRQRVPEGAANPESHPELDWLGDTVHCVSVGEPIQVHSTTGELRLSW